MEDKEFSDAVDAYLDYTANAWQTFLVEDNFDQYNNQLDILDFFEESEVEAIGESIKEKIDSRINSIC